MADTGTAGSSKVQNLCAGLDVDLVQTTKDTSGQFTPEGVPHAVLSLDFFSSLSIRGSLDGYPLLAVDGLARHEVFGDEQLLFSFCDEDTGMSVGFEDDSSSSSATTSSASGT